MTLPIRLKRSGIRRHSLTTRLLPPGHAVDRSPKDGNNLGASSFRPEPPFLSTPQTVQWSLGRDFVCDGEGASTLFGCSGVKINPCSTRDANYSGSTPGAPAQPHHRLGRRSPATRGAEGPTRSLFYDS